jgi:UDP-glucose 4-epimerase
LVTGAAGFIGRHLVRRLQIEGHEVTAFDKRDCCLGTRAIKGDITSFDFSSALKDVEVVFHLASLLGTAELFHRVVEAERVNVIGTLNLLEAMRKKEVDKIVFTSKPNIWKYNVYTITKETCERYLEMYKKVYGLKPVITRPFNVYGPEEELNEYRKAIPYFIIAALRGEPLEIFGDGEQTMDAIYIDDAVEALIRCAKVAPEEIVEIGSAHSTKVQDLAQKIINLTGSTSSVVHIPKRRGETDANHIRANGNMKPLISYSPKVSLEDGLKKTINWYSENLEKFKEIYRVKKEDFQTSDGDSCARL